MFLCDFVVNTNLKIAFATCRALNGLTPDDQLAFQPLQEKGISVETVAWDDNRADWSRYDAVILRTTWDYHQRLPEFLTWIEYLEKKNIALWNPPDVIRSNVNKRYLIDFQNAGIPTVPTIWIAKGTKTKLADVLNDHGWPAAIVKPDVSASAYRTWYADLQSASDVQPALDEILNDSGALIQEFRNEINSGEWSFLFFQRKFSHAVIKRPAAGDFRVQEELGGIVEPKEPPRSFVSQAEAVLNQIEGALLYARVDGIMTNHEFLLMELELIEPSLFLGSSQHAAEDFAKNIEELVRSKSS